MEKQFIEIMSLHSQNILNANQTAFNANAKKKHAEKIKRQTHKYNLDKAFYQTKLDAMVNDAMLEVTDHISQSDLELLCQSYEKKWLVKCAFVRKTNSVLKLNVQAFRIQFLIELQKKYQPKKVVKQKKETVTKINPKTNESILRIER